MIKINFNKISNKIKSKTNKIPRISGNNIKRRSSKFISNLRESPRRFKVFSKKLQGSIKSQIEKLKKAQITIPSTKPANSNQSNKKPATNRANATNKPKNGNRANGNRANGNRANGNRVNGNRANGNKANGNGNPITNKPIS